MGRLGRRDEGGDKSQRKKSAREGERCWEKRDYGCGSVGGKARWRKMENRDWNGCPGSTEPRVERREEKRRKATKTVESTV